MEKLSEYFFYSKTMDKIKECCEICKKIENCLTTIEGLVIKDNPLEHHGIEFIIHKKIDGKEINYKFAICVQTIYSPSYFGKIIETFLIMENIYIDTNNISLNNSINIIYSNVYGYGDLLLFNNISPDLANDIRCIIKIIG